MDGIPTLPNVLIAGLLFVGMAAGQSALGLQGPHVASEVSAITAVLFGRNTPRCVQFVDGASLFQGPMRIAAAALRLDGGEVTDGVSMVARSRCLPARCRCSCS